MGCRNGSAARTRSSRPRGSGSRCTGTRRAPTGSFRSTSSRGSCRQTSGRRSSGPHPANPRTQPLLGDVYAASEDPGGRGDPARARLRVPQPAARDDRGRAARRATRAPARRRSRSPSRSGSRSGTTGVAQPRGGGGPGVHPELREHVLEVSTDGARRDPEHHGDLGIREPLGDEVEHLALPRRQARPAMGARAGTALLVPRAMKQGDPRTRRARTAGTGSGRGATPSARARGPDGTCAGRRSDLSARTSGAPR